MLKLIASLTSPFVRKVRIALAEKKIEYQIHEVSPWAPGNPVHAFSPLGKVPVLVLDDGMQLFDSRVIVEYLDTVSPVSRLIPEPSRQRIVVRRWEALADGICDAALEIVVEGRRPARQQSREWIARQRQKVDAGVAELARDLADKPGATGTRIRSRTSRPAARWATSTCAIRTSPGATRTRTSRGWPKSSASARRSRTPCRSRA